MFKKILFIACVFAVAIPLVVAQAPPPPPPFPGLMIPLPEGMMPPPPEDGPEAFEAFLGNVFGMIAGDDGVMTLEELREWMGRFEPPMDDGGEMGSGSMPCGDEGEVGGEVPRADCDGMVSSAGLWARLRASINTNCVLAT